MTKSILGAPYEGRKADEYEKKRVDKKKWLDEQKLVVEMLGSVRARARVLDVPTGTGRFLRALQERKAAVTAMDISDDMLAKARTLRTTAKFEKGDVTALDYVDGYFDTTVCVRMLHLMPEKEMNRALKEILRVTSRAVILTIQMRDEYYEGGDTATHVKKKFYAAVKRAGWGVADEHKITGAGWYVIQLLRTKA